MSGFQGLAHVHIDGEKVEIEHIDIETDLSDKEIFGVDHKECDDCGGLIHPTDMVMVASTDKDKGGVYHINCYNE